MSKARSDRLFALIAVLRNGEVHRAADLAARFSVSERTIYRDMEALVASGLPVAGTPGSGYTLTAPVTLPPLNQTLAELEALHLGLAVIAEAGDPDLQAAARGLSDKIDAALPEDRAEGPEGWGLAVYPFADAAHGYAHVPAIRAAIRSRQKLRITVEGQRPEVIRPLQVDFWGRIWTVAAWSEDFGDFTTTRVDQITALQVLPQLFVDEAGKTLADFRKAQA